MSIIQSIMNITCSPKLSSITSVAHDKISDNFNPLIATLKPQSNRPSYSNTLIATLAVDGSALKHLVQQGGD